MNPDNYWEQDFTNCGYPQLAVVWAVIFFAYSLLPIALFSIYL